MSDSTPKSILFHTLLAAGSGGGVVILQSIAEPDVIEIVQEVLQAPEVQSELKRTWDFLNEETGVEPPPMSLAERFGYTEYSAFCNDLTQFRVGQHWLDQCLSSEFVAGASLRLEYTDGKVIDIPIKPLGTSDLPTAKGPRSRRTASPKPPKPV